MLDNDLTRAHIQRPAPHSRRHRDPSAMSRDAEPPLDAIREGAGAPGWLPSTNSERFGY